jgi:hypothetical protein
MVEGGIETQTGDAGDTSADHGRQEFEGGQAAVGHQDQPSPGQSLARLQNHLPCPVGELLVAPAALAAVPLRGRQGGQERQPLRG